MQSKTSFFNPTLFKKNLSRFWPLWGGAVLIAVLPPPAMLTALLDRGFRSHGMEPLEMTSAYYYVVSWAVPIISLFYAALCALAVWHYLYNHRSVSFYHALPVTRNGLFATNFLSGMAMMLIPYAAAGGLSVLISIPAGIFEPLGVFMTILYVIGQSFFYFASATLIIFFTGNPFAFAAFYFIFHFFAVLAEMLVTHLMSMFYLGIVQGYEGVTEFLSPTVYLFQNLYPDAVTAEVVTADGWVDYGHLQSVTLDHGWVIGVYALIGVVFLACAWSLYQRRRSESAGDVVAVGWMKPVFRYGVALCSALVLGFVLYNVVWSSFQHTQTADALPMAVCMSIAGVIGYYVASMLLAKSVKVFRDTWKGALATAFASALICCVIAADPAGVESWVPDAEALDSVSVNIYGANGGSCSADLEDPAAIQRVLDAHRAIVGDRDVLDGGTRGSLGDVHVNLIYFDKDGKFHYRYYNIYIEDESVTQTNVYKALAALAADPVIQEASVFGDVTNNAEEVRLTGGYVEGLYDTETRGFVSTDLTKEQAQALEAAVRRDIEAGRFGRTLFMLDYNEYIDSVYRFSIQIHYTVTREYRDGSTRTNSDNVYLTPSVYCTETIKALEQAGVITDSRRPLTRRQYDENRRYDDEGEWWDYEKYGADAEIYA